MNKVPVDRELFVTCRLCLKDLGQYQIIPSIQEQIKYCFDIVVEPFDSLPQLICHKCESILSEYHAVKKNYVEKQTLLKQRIEIQKASLLREVKHDKDDKEEVQCRRTSTPSDLHTRPTPVNTPVSSVQEEVDQDVTESETWDSEYVKKYICRFCKHKVQNKIKIIKHVRNLHSSIKHDFPFVFNRTCYVKIDKFDNKPNITQCKDTVVLNKKKIILSCPDYFVQYTPQKNLNDRKRRDNHSSDSSEDSIYVPSKCKRRRLSSESVNTVVIDKVSRESLDAGDCDANNTQCIEIDDSSDESDKNKEHSNNSSKNSSIVLDASDYRSIENIMSSCHTKYIKKIDSLETKKVIVPVNTYTDSHLNHKILSIGRKILKGHSFNCAGLLRYLEHKNLTIQWQPINNVSATTSTIIITTNNFTEKSCNDLNWVDYVDNDSEIIKLIKEPSLEKKIEKENGKTTNTTKSNGEHVQSPDTQILNKPCTEEKQISAKTHRSYRNPKLLNANPVPNPKQMPSKSVITEVNSGNKSVHSNENVPDTETVVTNTDTNASFSMPVITSIQSLTRDSIDVIMSTRNTNSATPEANKKENNNNNSNSNPENTSTKDTAYPRIKVKPAAELMSAKALSELAKENASVDKNLPGIHQRPLGAFTDFVEPYIARPLGDRDSNIPNGTLATEDLSMTPATQGEENLSTTQAPQKVEFVILDTVQMPNTRTQSPFQYLKNLLQMHNLHLYDNTEMIEKFHCLIKFKVSFKRAMAEDPILVALSLYNNVNIFCLHVKDVDNIFINISTLSPIWQWELIKVFSGDVAKKLAANATKVGPNTKSVAIQFISLLNSIQFKKDN